MNIKISRVQQARESYNITADWLSDFSNSLTKEAQIIEVFRNQRSEKFATIEEKMEDMKKRVGFSNIENVKGASSIDKSAGECTECEDCRSKRSNKQDIVSKLKSIINYVKETKKDRPDISHMQMIADCKELPEYKDISQKISYDKFKDYIINIVDENKQPYKGEIVYVPQNEAYQLSDNDDMAAPYMPKE